MQLINTDSYLSLKKYNDIIFSLISAKKLILLLILIITLGIFLLPIPFLASEYIKKSNISANTAKEEKYEIIENDESQVEVVIIDQADIENYKTIKTSYHTITAYNSEVGQCDNSPCITANGFNLCEHGIEDSVAANFLKFGTKIKIPDIFGDRIFVVRDRMNKRHADKIDIWMLEREDAVKFGAKIAKIEILEEL